MPLFPIAYPIDKPGAGLAAPRAGHRLSEIDGAWVVEAEDVRAAAACQAWLEAYDDDAAQKAAAKLLVKREAGRRIEAAMPLWRQLNLARERGGHGRVGAVVDPIRAASDAIEAEIDAMTTAQAHEFDENAVRGSSRWPAA